MEAIDMSVVTDFLKLGVFAFGSGYLTFRVFNWIMNFLYGE